MKLAIVALLVQFSWAADEDPNLTQEVNYYENLITTGIIDADHYQLPINNEEYKPQHSFTCEGKTRFCKNLLPQISF